MRIAVCDDEKIYRDEIENVIKNFIFKTECDIGYEMFSDPSELLGADKFDLYILDYIMPQMNGVELAVKLREKFSGSITVCYLTSYETAAVDVINKNVEAQAFLVKPVKEEELCSLLNRFYNDSAKKRLVLKKGRSNMTVYTQEILYAEASNKNTLLHFSDKTEEFSYLFGEMFDAYLDGKGFIKVQRSFAVNLAHVAKYDKNTITMDNGETVPCKKMKEFVAAFDKYNFENF